MASVIASLLNQSSTYHTLFPKPPGEPGGP